MNQILVAKNDGMDPTVHQGLWDLPTEQGKH